MMNEFEKDKLLEKLFLLAEVLKFELSEKHAMAYVKIIASRDDLDFGSVCSGIESLMLSAKSNSGFPSIKDICDHSGIKLPESKSDDRDDARMVAAKIIANIQPLGRNASKEAVLERIGELGLAVVEMKGGWQKICETMLVDDERTWEAQFRDLAESMLHRARRGVLDELPRLPGKSSSFVDEQVKIALTEPTEPTEPKKET